jgi:hypothetical protein
MFWMLPQTACVIKDGNAAKQNPDCVLFKSRACMN